MIQSGCLQSQLLKECFGGEIGEHRPPLPHFRHHSNFVASDINIESEHNIQAKYNFLIQNKVLPQGSRDRVLEVHNLLQNNLLEGSRGKGPGPCFFLKSVTLSDDGCVTRWQLVWRGAKDAGKVHSRFS